MATDWILERLDGLLVAACGSIGSVVGVGHAFSTRDADGEDGGFDLGPGASGFSAPFVDRTRDLARAVGLESSTIAVIRQVHADRVLRLRDEDSGAERIPDADGAIALQLDGGGQMPAVRTADCVPVLIAERTGRAVAAVHVGWRGAAAGIARRAVEQLAGAGIAPGRLLAGVGPAVGACCYEVSHEVVSRVCHGCPVAAEQVSRPGPRERPMLDLPGAVAAQLGAAGIAPAAISVAPWCTSCHEELFFSFRRDGSETGRMMALIGWTTVARKGALARGARPLA